MQRPTERAAGGSFASSDPPCDFACSAYNWSKLAALRLDRQRAIVWANETAEMLLVDGSLVRRRDGRLILTDSESDRAFARQVRERSVEYCDIPDLLLLSRSPQSIIALYSLDGTCELLTVIRQSGRVSPVALIQVANLFGLTPAEVRVLSALLASPSLKHAQDEIGVSSNTIRTQTKSIYAKLGAANKAEAIRVIVELSV